LPRSASSNGLASVPTSANGHRGSHAGSLSLITGGAGFIGTNLAHRLLSGGKRVRVYDDLSRPGVERNVRWLRAQHGSRLAVQIGDVRDATALRQALADVDDVYHLAAQVAVTTSLARPLHDLEVNVRGTLNLLEEVRRLDDPPKVLYTSTNKVYGALSDLRLVRDGDRWAPESDQLARRGLDEKRPLDMCTPYGCSKGAADQYVLDYAKSFGLRTVVFRMSCIYGPHQHGNEDQGWVAHFLLQALAGRPITIYGDGAQVRDVLFVDDVVDAMLLAQKSSFRPEVRGCAFNIGGGRENAVSLLEVVDLIAELTGERPELEFAEERPGDQRYYVSDTTRFAEATGWTPAVSVRHGLEELQEWLERGRRPVAATAR
jgi:CDP-paratose 2-epimerase